MAALNEATEAVGPENTLAAGWRTLSLDQSIRFVQYVRKVLPLDGYVFWLATQQTEIHGSLHYPADKQQREDETISISRVMLTTTTEVQQFTVIAPNTIWVGEAAGLKFAFSQQGPYYQAAGQWHYSGDAVYPAMETQLADLGSINDRELIVSNSLPAWLQLVNYTPEWLIAGNPGITLYPSFLVPDNLPPPYGAVHIDPDQTQPMGALPVIGYRGAHSQLASDQVRITLYGANNEQAAAFLDLIYQFSSDTDLIGVMQQTGIIRDAKRTQAELGVIAMKKTISLQVSYLQSAIHDCARQMIEKATASVLPQPYVAGV